MNDHGSDMYINHICCMEESPPCWTLGGMIEEKGLQLVYDPVKIISI